MSPSLIRHLPTATPMPTRSDDPAPTDATPDATPDAALTTTADAAFAELLRGIAQSLDTLSASPADGATVEVAGDNETRADAQALPGPVEPAVLPAMTMWMAAPTTVTAGATMLLGAGQEGGGLSVAMPIAHDAAPVGGEVAEVAARTDRSAAALPATVQSHSALAVPVAGAAGLPPEHIGATPLASTSEGGLRPAATLASEAWPIRPAAERHLLLTPTDAAAVTASAAPGRPIDPDALAADTVVQLPAATPSSWRPPLQAALADRLQMQLGQGSDQALIRLDPPMWGRIEILVRHEGGGIQVHLSATHVDVVRQLMHLTDSLRQDLMSRQQGEVSVAVSHSHRDAAGRERSSDQPQRDDTTPHRALTEADQGASATSAFTLAHDGEGPQ